MNLEEIPKAILFFTEDTAEENDLDNIDELGASAENTLVKSKTLNQSAMQNFADPDEIPNLLEHLNIRFPEIINDDYSYGEDEIVSEYMQMFLQNVLYNDSNIIGESQPSVSDYISYSSTLDQVIDYNEKNQLSNVTATFKNSLEDQERYASIGNNETMSKIITNDISNSNVYENKQKVIPLENAENDQEPHSEIKKYLVVTPRKELFVTPEKEFFVTPEKKLLATSEKGIFATSEKGIFGTSEKELCPSSGTTKKQRWSKISKEEEEKRVKDIGISFSDYNKMRSGYDFRQRAKCSYKKDMDGDEPDDNIILEKEKGGKHETYFEDDDDDEGKDCDEETLNVVKRCKGKPKLKKKSRNHPQDQASNLNMLDAIPVQENSEEKVNAKLDELYEAYSKGSYRNVLDILETNDFPEDCHETLRKLFYACHYELKKMETCQDLGPVQKHRVRKSNPLPRTIWDGDEISYSFKATSRITLVNFYKQNKCPDRKEKALLATQTGLTFSQVENWFKNRRQRDRNTDKV